MKKVFNKTINLLVVVAFVLHMFTPLTVFAADNITVWIAWNCDNKVCVDDLEVSTYDEDANHVRTYADNYIQSNTVVDSAKSKTLVASKVTSYGKGRNHHPEFYIFNSDPRLNASFESEMSWEDFGMDFHEASIDPTGGKDGINSISHNGDRNFRLTIYDTGYTPIVFDVDHNNYTYFLGEWEDVFTNPVYDISGTTEEKPLEYRTYLLENNLQFRMNGIKSVKALNVPNKGIDVRVADQSLCTITFKSNYYSDVTFEITLNNGNKYYLKVNRVFVEMNTNRKMNPGGNYSKLEAYASFMYPSNKSHDDYDVFATITTESGTTTKKLTAAKVKYQDARDGVIEDTEFYAGENLLMSFYPLGIDGTVKDVKITVTKKDATVGTAYGGTFGGYGEGVSLNDIDLFVEMLNRPMV